MSDRTTEVFDLPAAVLSSIFTFISDTRTRNNASLVCRDWYYADRQTRTSLSLRGNVSNAVSLPVSFRQVTSLDLSCCSPWGHSLFADSSDVEEALKDAFPYVTSVSLYVRHAVDISTIASIWPDLESVRLARWHQRNMPEGNTSDMEPLFKLEKLARLDLSQYYCWTEDIPPILQSAGVATESLRSLNLLKISPDGFKAQEVAVIATCCRNLEELFILCEFDPRYVDYVGDVPLALIGSNCSKLRVLHLVDSTEWRDNERSPQSMDSTISVEVLMRMFAALSFLEDLVFLLGQDLIHTGKLFESMAFSCKNLRSLEVSHFHGVCNGNEKDGLASCSGLTELSLKDCIDLTDSGLAAISLNCKLKKLGLVGCGKITENGLDFGVSKLSGTLRCVKITECAQLPTVAILRALSPVQGTIQRLQMDCQWDETGPGSVSSTTNRADTSSRVPCENSVLRGIGSSGHFDPSSSSCGRLKLAVGHGVDNFDGEAADSQPAKRRLVCSETQQPLWTSPEDDDGCWSKLQTLSLWAGLNTAISSLPSTGLVSCPALKEITIRVEGNCGDMKRRETREWGLASLSRYSNLSVLNLDFSEVVGYSLTARSGQVDLDYWERYFLGGIRHLKLWELDYKPPCDRDLNRRALSLPATGLLSECVTIRKLIVHGTAHEHWLGILQRIRNLRDFQLRWDYFPVPQHEMSTELRNVACQRFEEAMAERGHPD